MKRQIKIAMLVLCIVSAVTFTLGNTMVIPVEAASGKWEQDGHGWWYQNPDGSYPCNTWKEIDGEWYHFNENGYMQTGWLQDWIPVDFQEGWYTLDYYYLNPSGAMATGWVFDGGNWYYMQPDGLMAEGWIEFDGKKYFLRYESGEMVTNEWLGSSYVDASGALVANTDSTGWKQDSIGWWYQNPDGTYAKNQTLWDDGDAYGFDANGYMVSNSWLYSSQYGFSKWRYYGADGKLVYAKWVGNYFVDHSGAMVTRTFIGNYYVDENGLHSGRVCTHSWEKYTPSSRYIEQFYHPDSKADAAQYCDAQYGYFCLKCNTLREDYSWMVAHYSLVNHNTAKIAVAIAE